MSTTAVRRRQRLTALAALVLVLVALLSATVTHLYDTRHRAGSTPAVAATAPVPPASGSLAGLKPAAQHPKPSATQDATFDAQTRNSLSAVTGQDGYKFLGDVYLHNFSMAMGRRYYSPEEVERTAATIDSTRAWLAQRSISYDFAVAPGKWAVYPEKLPAWTKGQRLPTIVDQLVAYEPGTVTDLRPALTAGRARGNPYSRKNSHWSTYGGWVAWKALAADLTKRDPGLGAVPVPSLTGVKTQDSDNEFKLIDGDPGPNDWDVPQFVTPPPAYDLVSADGSRAPQASMTRLDVSNAPLLTVNPKAGNTHRLLVLGDSTVTAVTPYLTTAFHDTLIVRHFIDDPAKAPSLPALVDQFHPDAVLTLTTERNLDMPITDLGMWQAATAYAAAPEAGTATWSTSSAASGGLAVDGDPKSGTLDLTLPPAAAGAGALVRLDLISKDAGALELRGATTAGPVSVSVRVPPGTTQTYAQLPPGLTGGTLTLARTAGAPDLAVTGISVRHP